jgi:hypothetical protein
LAINGDQLSLGEQKIIHPSLSNPNQPTYSRMIDILDLLDAIAQDPPAFVSHHIPTGSLPLCFNFAHFFGFPWLSFGLCILSVDLVLLLNTTL